ncbi:MAG TPA: tetratricopeptide repeat protein [Blastocatellia bacterium]|nr:tetratricopeptide repeat protein [Blastocatellia bacterium]
MNFRLLFQLLWQPLIAVKRIRDRAPVAFAVSCAWLMSVVYILIVAPLMEYAQRGGLPMARPAGGARGALGGLAQIWLSSSFQAVLIATMLVLFVAVIYVPFAILIANLFERRESFSIAIREEYAPTVSCTLVSLAVSLLVTVFPAIVISWQTAWLSSDAVIGYIVLLMVIPLPVFAALMTLTIGTIFRIGWIAAVGTTLISFLSLLGMPLLMQAATFICASPFLFLLLLFLLRDRIDDFMKSARARHSFKQNLEASTLNPADASAHYNLGLLYQNRGELESAVDSFRRAVEIDERETDAHYQLGRISREQGRLQESIAHFERVVEQNPSHSHHEIWRETALVYYAAGQYADALEMMDRFLSERPSDAQGHYWRGMTLTELGRGEEAIQEMQGCIESVKTAPAYKYRTERQWLHLAQSYLRERQ